MAKKKSSSKNKTLLMNLLSVLFAALGVQLLVMGIRIQWIYPTSFSFSALIAIVAAIAFLFASKSSLD